jgi:hypothetical protein
MPMMTDAANEKIVRRDMITVLPRLPKKHPLSALDDFGTVAAGRASEIRSALAQAPDFGFGQPASGDQRAAFLI